MNSRSVAAELREKKGVILIIVLWAVAMMTVVIAALSTNVRTSSNLAGTETRRLKTEVLLDGAVDIAAAAILASGDQVQTVANGHTTRVDLGNGNLADLKIRDAASVIDINRAEDIFLANLITRVTASADIGKTTAGLITQWRTKMIESAEDSEPAAFISTAQLYDVPDIDRKTVAAIMPFVGLYSNEGQVYLLAAPEEVIASIPDATPVEIETLLAARNSGDVTSEAVEDVLDNLEDYVTVESTKVFIVDAALVQSASLITGSHLRATIVVDGSGAAAPYHVLSRSW